jgi:hypothetical protein
MTIEPSRTQRRNLIEVNHKSEVVTKAASTHANWWGYYRQKD